MFFKFQFKEAFRLVERCEADLKRKLSDGERRDLFKDNTKWPSNIIAEIVAAFPR